MIKKLAYVLITFFTLISSSYALTTITFESDYGIKNVLLFIFLLFIFLFWTFIYRFTEELNFDRNNLLKSTTNFGIKILCWIWFISLFYIFQSVLFISSSESFLSDKLDLIYSLLFLSMIIMGVLGLLNSFKIYNKMTGTIEFFKQLIFEVKSGGKK